MRWFEIKPNSWFKLEPHSAGTVVFTVVMFVIFLLMIVIMYSKGQL